MEQASTVSESRPRRVARLAVMRAFAFLRRIPFREGQLLGSLEKVFPARREEIRRNGLRLYEIRYRKTPDGMETEKRLLAEIAPEM
jgi:hypothetical protein